MMKKKGRTMNREEETMNRKEITIKTEGRLMKRKAVSKAMGLMVVGMLLFGLTAQASAQSTESLYGPGSDFIVLIPNTGIVKNYTLDNVLSFKELNPADYHATYILAFPTDFSKPAPYDLTVTTTPTVKPGDVAVAVVGIIDVTPTYNLNYASGGKITTKYSGIPYGVGVLFTFVTRSINDPELGEPVFPVAVKQEFSFVPTPKK
jgi:hypothetical protein